MQPGNLETMDDLENYAEYSQSPLLYLMLEAMGIKDESAEFAASHLGVCKGILTLLRGSVKHRSQVRVASESCLSERTLIVHASNILKRYRASSAQ